VVKLPLFTSLRGYDSGWLRGDAVAGLTVWAVLVPEALAYASIAGVSPVVGLYAAFGSSRHLVVGPMSATAALSAAAVADVATEGTAGFVAHTAAGPASRPPTTAPAPRPSWCRCSCPASRWSPPS
jgi:sulfate permease, SulP family